ncbi:pyridoxal-phosphate dependent enzyme [Spongiibacter sp. KMU-158]|uniref:Pyridoxal-phosphate dependent enzyme n=1 Tax=Spongiibacter pelagi TaxID=2760804 RepID=A0A927GX17_9GAMM|nr:pyridoxal-phosphate dependent enzyme [Spongiibacter pelagi]MBD2858979.1 pyridoxal-phosphate dependent enzyme [Spongiibacter pelagi]
MSGSVITSLGDCYGVKWDVLRLDQLHPLAPGNKWFKLRGALLEAERLGRNTLISFGGPWSNHLHALAAVGKGFDFNTVGFVRAGSNEPVTPCLADAKDWGMQLRFLSYSDYRRRHDAEFIADIQADFPDALIIPEGGASHLGVASCAEIASLIPEGGEVYDAVFIACGTGATLAGLVLGLAGRAPVIGVPVVKGASYLQRDIAAMLAEQGLGDSAAEKWSLDFRVSQLGFGRLNDELIEYIHHFEARTGLLLDPVYTAKLFFHVDNLCRAGEFAPGQRVLLVHTGGLQGRRGFPEVFS